MTATNLRPCGNPLCDYWLLYSAKFCCTGCANAHERGYEIHEDGPLGHSSNCYRRHPSAAEDTEGAQPECEVDDYDLEAREGA